MNKDSVAEAKDYDPITLMARASVMSEPITMVPPENPDESEVINDENSDRSIGYLIKSQVHLPFERGWYIDGRSGEAFFADLEVKNFRIVSPQTKVSTDFGNSGDFAWDANNLYLYTGSSWQSVPIKTFPYGTEFTSGKFISAGSAVSVESDEKVYPTRLLDIDSEKTNQNIAIGVSPKTNSHCRVFDHSATIKASVRQLSGATSPIYLFRHVIDPAAATFSSSSSAALTGSGAMTNTYFWDAKRFDSTRYVVAWVNVVGGVTQLSTKVVDISSGITQGSVLQIATAAGLSTSTIAISVESSTKYVVWYQDSSTGIKAQRCVVSGSTVTLGTATSITTDTSDQVLGASLFSDSLYHLVAYDDSSAGYAVFQCGISSSGTMVMGSAEPCGVYSGGASSSLHSIISLDSTTCVSFNSYNNSGWNVYERCVTRSGSSLTVRASTGAINDMTNGNQYPPGVLNLGNRDVALVFACDPTLSGIKFSYHRLLHYADTSFPSFVGSSWYNVNTEGGPCGLARGTGSTLFVSGSLLSTPTTIRGYLLDHTNNFDGFIGIALESAAGADETINVQTYEKVSNMSNLSTSLKHYTQPSGLAMPYRTYNAERVGTAVSDTELVIQP